MSGKRQGFRAWAAWELGAVWALCRSFHVLAMTDREGRRAGAQARGEQGQGAEVLSVVTGPGPGRYLNFAGNETPAKLSRSGPSLVLQKAAGVFFMDFRRVESWPEPVGMCLSCEAPRAAHCARSGQTAAVAASPGSGPGVLGQGPGPSQRNAAPGTCRAAGKESAGRRHGGTCNRTFIIPHGKSLK